MRACDYAADTVWKPLLTDLGLPYNIKPDWGFAMTAASDFVEAGKKACVIAILPQGQLTGALVALLVVAFHSLAAFAQTTGTATVVGVTTDSTGAVVAGAK